jgi:transposase
MSRTRTHRKKQYQKKVAATKRRYELTDMAFERIEPLLPKQTPGGRWNDHRIVLNGIFWILNSGAQWRDLPERYGKWQTIYDRFRRWTREGLFDRILNRLHLELDADGRINWDVFDVDGSNIRAHQSAAGAAKKSSKKGENANPRNPPTTPWDDRAAALVQSFIF